MNRKWEVLHSEYLIQRPWLTARRDCVRLPNGVENDEYYVLEYPDWVNVIAITAEGKFWVSRNFVGIIFYTRKVLLTSHYEKRLFEYASQPRVAGSDIRLLSYLWS